MFERIFGIDIKKKTQMLKSRNPNLLDLIGVDKNNNIIINYKDIINININNNNRYSYGTLTLLLLTEITYKDENNFTQNILVNFGQSTPQAQGLIYKKC